MPDRENVIHAVKTAFDVWIDEYTGCSWFKEDEVRQAKDDAIALLKEQEAVKPIITPWITNDDGEAIVSRMECGKCKCQFYYEEQKYCSECGTPILWEGGEVE